MNYSFSNNNEHSYYHAIHNPLESCQRFQKILDDIDKKNAVVINTQISKQRIRKMLNKGWTISSNTFILTPIKLNVTDDDSNEETCIICHENFTPFNINSNLGPAYKLYCCEAKYHMKCMIHTCNNTGPAAIQNTKRCIMCRKNTFIDDEKDFMINVINEIKSIYNKQPILQTPIRFHSENSQLINQLFPYLEQ